MASSSLRKAAGGHKDEDEEESEDEDESEDDLRQSAGRKREIFVNDLVMRTYRH